MMKKTLVLIGFIMCAPVLHNHTVSASMPCRQVPPSFDSEFRSHYENVRIDSSTCYFTFSFESPVTYSSHKIKYRFTNDAINLTSTFAEFDNAVRSMITRIDACPSLDSYVAASERSMVLVAELLDGQGRTDVWVNIPSLINLFNSDAYKNEDSGSVSSVGYYRSVSPKRTQILVGVVALIVLFIIFTLVRMKMKKFRKHF